MFFFYLFFMRFKCQNERTLCVLLKIAGQKTKNWLNSIWKNVHGEYNVFNCKVNFFNKRNKLETTGNWNWARKKCRAFGSVVSFLYRKLCTLTPIYLSLVIKFLNPTHIYWKRYIFTHLKCKFKLKKVENTLYTCIFS